MHTARSIKLNTSWSIRCKNTDSFEQKRIFTKSEICSINWTWRKSRTLCGLWVATPTMFTRANRLRHCSRSNIRNRTGSELTNFASPFTGEMRTKLISQAQAWIKRRNISWKFAKATKRKMSSQDIKRTPIGYEIIQFVNVQNYPRNLGYLLNKMSKIS